MNFQTILSCVFILISTLLAPAASAGNKCHGVTIEDYSSIVPSIPFIQVEIAPDYTGVAGYYEVIDQTGKQIESNYDEAAMRQRAVTYYQQGCSPEKIIYPDLRLVAHEYVKGKAISRLDFTRAGTRLNHLYRYDDSGNLEFEAPVNHDKVNGKAIYYLPNHQINYKLNFENGVRNGCFKSHHDKGELKAVGCFKNDRLIGQYSLYYPNGQLQTEANYSQSGYLNGEYKEWYESGKVKIVTQYINGKIDKIKRGYFEGGQVSELFVDGTAIKPGYHQTYFKDHTVKSNVAVINGLYEGPYKLLFDNYQLALKVNYKNGKKNGKEYSYSKEGIIEYICVYNNGMPVSRYTYFPHGGIATKEKYSKDGILTQIKRFDIFGHLSDKTLFSNKATESKTQRYFVNGKLAAQYEINQGKFSSPIIGYNAKGQELYRIQFNPQGEVETAYVAQPGTAFLKHALKKTEKGYIQATYDTEGNPIMVSQSETSGKIKTNFFTKDRKEPTMGIERDADGTINRIYYQTGIQLLACVKGSNSNYNCGFIDNTTHNITPYDSSKAFAMLTNRMKDNSFTKVDLSQLLFPDSPNSLYVHINNDISNEGVTLNGQQHCYNLGFMRHCE